MGEIDIDREVVEAAASLHRSARIPKEVVGCIVECRVGMVVALHSSTTTLSARISYTFSTFACFDSHLRFDLSVRVGGVAVRDAQSHGIGVAVYAEEAGEVRVRLGELREIVKKCCHGDRIRPLDTESV